MRTRLDELWAAAYVHRETTRNGLEGWDFPENDVAWLLAVYAKHEFFSPTKKEKSNV